MGTTTGISAWKPFDELPPDHLLPYGNRMSHYSVYSDQKDREDIVNTTCELGHRYKMFVLNWSPPNPWAKPILAGSAAGTTTE